MPFSPAFPPLASEGNRLDAYTTMTPGITITTTNQNTQRSPTAPIAPSTDRIPLTLLRSVRPARFALIRADDVLRVTLLRGVFRPAARRLARKSGGREALHA